MEGQGEGDVTTPASADATRRALTAPTRCPICARGDASSWLGHVDGYEVWRCAECETDFVFPLPSAAELASHYDRVAYFEGGERGGYESYDRQTAWSIELFDRLLDELGDRPGASVLDVGCGYGSHLARARDRGWTCFGVDVSGHARRVAGERHGDHLHLFESIERLPPHAFDLIVFFDALEHLREPERAFHTLFAKGAIVPETVVVVTTPNAGSRAARADSLAWEFRYPPSHLTFFSARSLRTLFSRLRFTDIDVTGLHPSLETTGAPVAAADPLLDFGGLLCRASGSDLMRERDDPRDSSVDVGPQEIAAAAHVNELAMRANPRVPRKLRRLIELALAPLRRVRAALRGLGPRRGPGSTETFTPYLVRVPRGQAGRPRILHVIANFITGGSSQLVVDLIERLGDAYEQHVVTRYKPSPESYLGAPVSEIPLEQAPTIRSFMHTFGPDLIHVHFWRDYDQPWYLEAFRAAETLGVPIIENINVPVEPHRSARVARYVFVSDFVRETFGRGLDGRSLRIYPGTDFETFRRDPAAARPGDVLGMVYRLEPDKLDARAIDVFIEAVRIRPATRVLIVGGGTLLEPFRRAVAAAKMTAAFEFTGYVGYAQLPSLYARMTVFVAPVWCESFGQVSTFAMSMGVPVVGYAVGGLPEVIADPALCAPPRDARALARIAVGLLDDDAARARIAGRNRERVRESFAIDTMIDAYRRLYGEVLRGTA